MTVREALTQALDRDGSEVLLPKSLIAKVLELLGPEPDIEGHQHAPIRSIADFHKRYGCLDLWHVPNSVSYHVYLQCPSCSQTHPEPWKLQKIPGDGTGC
ncbi:MAG: hypothetical protein C4586_05815 [Anaerolineaceae bacterium]|nr:MAG: hypothetical protein C4586_05815 [Anaerolineaceae bacterium]